MRLFAVALFVVAIRLAATGLAQTNGIQLVQVASVSVPASFEISGGTLSESGALLFWSRENKAVMWTDGRLTRTLCPGSSIDPLAASFARSSSSIEIVDGHSGRVVSATSRGSCLTGRRLAPPGTIVAASYVHKTDEWVGLTAANGQSALVFSSDGKGLVEVPLSLRPAALRAMHMTPSVNGVVLSSLMAPHEWLSVSREGQTLMRGQPFTRYNRLDGL